jgi:hypothetical protein
MPGWIWTDFAGLLIGFDGKNISDSRGDSCGDRRVFFVGRE